MSCEKRQGKLCALLTGLGLGIGLGVLFAPQSGKETREDLKKRLDDFVNYLKGLDYNEVKDNLIVKVENLKKELAALDKEKVLEIAKVKAEEIKQKAEDIYNSALETGKPKIEAYAKEVKTQTIKVLKNILNSLEEEEETKKTPVKKVANKKA